MDNFAIELDRLSAECMQRVEQNFQQSLKRSLEQFAGEIQGLRAAALAEAATRVLPTTARVPPTTVLPAVPAAAPQTPDSFGAMLSEPTLPVVVQGETFHVHKVVLRGVPYFAALLDSGWRDAASPEVQLPCSAAEFGLLLKRLYTENPLGSAGLPVDDCAAALRLAAAAAMLLIDDRLPELPALLRALVRTPEDTAAAVAARDALPNALGNTLRDLSGTVDLSSTPISEAVAEASGEEARAALLAVLAASGAGVLAAPRERQSVAAILCRMPPQQLAEVLSTEVLAALRGFEEPLVARLSSDLAAAARWSASVDQLLASSEAGP